MVVNYFKGMFLAVKTPQQLIIEVDEEDLFLSDDQDDDGVEVKKVSCQGIIKLKNELCCKIHNYMYKNYD